MPHKRDVYEICTDEDVLDMAAITKSPFKPLKSLKDGGIVLDGIVAEQMGYYKEQQWVSGNVNLGNRIITDGVVLFLGNDSFKITPPGTEPVENPMQKPNFFNNKSKENPSAVVTATIDGEEYEGAEILVEGDSVTVSKAPQP